MKRYLIILLHIARKEAMLIGLLVGLLALTFVFSKVAQDVMQEDTQRLDERILRSLRQADNPSQLRGPAWVEQTVRDISALGSFTVATFVTLTALGYLLLARKRRATLLLAAAMAGGMGLSLGLKFFFDRPRPTIVPRLEHVLTPAFPSGHAMMSAVMYLTLGALLARVVPSKRLQLYVMAVAITITLMVGVSRVALGVHYPTDVLAGWTAGAAWALLCGIATYLLQRRGNVEMPTEAE